MICRQAPWRLAGIIMQSVVGLYFFILFSGKTGRWVRSTKFYRNFLISKSLRILRWIMDIVIYSRRLCCRLRACPLTMPGLSHLETPYACSAYGSKCYRCKDRAFCYLFRVRPPPSSRGRERAVLPFPDFCRIVECRKWGVLLCHSQENGSWRLTILPNMVWPMM